MYKKYLVPLLIIGLGVILWETESFGVEKVVIYPMKTAATFEAKSSFAPVIKDLKDPFQVDFSLTKKGEGAEISEPLERKTFNLQGVIVGASRSVALVDDNVLELGDYLNGWKLIGVKKDRVGFKKGSEIKKLYLSLGGISDGK